MVMIEIDINDKTKEIIEAVMEALENVEGIEVMSNKVEGSYGATINPQTMQPVIPIMVPTDNGPRLGYRIDIVDYSNPNYFKVETE